MTGFVAACALAGAMLCSAFAQGVTPSTLNLSTDAGAVTVHTVVHLTASLQSTGSAATGSVTFLDGASALALVPLDSRGIAVLGVASLSPGTHTVTAIYAGDSAHSSATSGSITVAVTGLPVSPISSAAQTSIYANQPVTLTVAGLPASATGSVAFSDGSNVLATVGISGNTTAAYQAFGDEITLGQAVLAGQSYTSLFASAEGFAVTNFGVPNSIACDLLPEAILAHGLGPTQTSAPLSSVMIGTIDVDNYGSAYLPLFASCDQAAIAWLAIPREYKVLPGDAGAAIVSGSWSSDPTTGALLNVTGSGSANFTLTSTGGPAYLWYLLGDDLPGSFSVTIDGVADTTPYNTQPTPAIGSLNHTPSTGFALLRLALSAGPHVLGVNVQAGTVGILGVATAPSPGAASVHPTVLVSDIPNQLTTSPVASPASIRAYTPQIQSSVTQFQADGLDVRLVSTEQTMLGTPAEMSDSIDPNSLGQLHVAQAFESSFGGGSTASYASFTGNTPAGSVTFAAPGTYSVTAVYSGDSTYASGTSQRVSITVLPQTVSITSLTTRTSSYPSGTPVLLTAMVVPASATGTVTFYDGTALLSQTTLTGGVATSTTDALALGVHQLTAVYNGDAPDAPSQSPSLAVRITPGATLVTLGPLATSAAYGSIPTITATVSPADASGTVTFEDSVSGTLGQAVLAGGMATVDASSLGVGVHTLTAVYSGDGSHLAATSVGVTVNISGIATATTLIAQPAQVTYGTLISLVASISPSSASGTVVFRDSSSGVLGTATVNSGVAVLNTSVLSAGSRSLSAAYEGDLIHASSVSVFTTVGVSLAPTSLTLAPLPASIPAGTALTLNATVNQAAATGTILFRDASAGILGQATINHGTASLLLSSLPVGSYSITAEYPGDTDNGGSSSLAVSTQIFLQASTSALGAVASSVPYATTISLAASVSPAAASGIMTFFDGVSVLGQAPLLGGQAMFKTAALGTGSHQIHVVYGGDGVYAASTSAAVSTTIVPASTSTTLSLAEVNVPLGALVVFDVRVITSSGSRPGGTVTILGNGGVLAVGSLANVTAGVGYATLSVSTSTTGFGNFGVVAYYSGDGNDSASDTTGTPASFNVVSSTTVTSLSVSSAQVPPETSVTLTASVGNPSPIIATGAVQFLLNGEVIATVPLDAAGSASTKLAAQPVGSYLVSARYQPSGVWAASVSGPQAFTVTLPIALVLTPSMVSLASGGSTTVTLGMSPLSGFSGGLQAQCQSSAPFVTCSIDAPSSISGPVNGVVHLTVAQNTLGASLPRRRSGLLEEVGTLAFLVPLFFRRRKGMVIAPGLLALCAMALISGCATGGDFGAIPAGRQLIVVSVTAAGTTTTAGIAVEVSR